MTRVRYLLGGVPTPGDPLGASPGADQTPTYVGGNIAFDWQDGTFDLLLDNDVRIIKCSEGDGVGQFRLTVRVPKSRLEQFENLIATVAAGSGVRSVAARAYLAAIKREGINASLDELESAITNTNLSDEIRMLALAFGTIILLEARD